MRLPKSREGCGGTRVEKSTRKHLREIPKIGVRRDVTLNHRPEDGEKRRRCLVDERRNEEHPVGHPARLRSDGSVDISRVARRLGLERRCKYEIDLSG